MTTMYLYEHYAEMSSAAYFYSVQLKTVHTAPWPHCPNKNVFSNCLNWPYDSQRSLRLGGRLFQTCGPVVRMQLSDTGVGDEWTAVGQ